MGTARVQSVGLFVPYIVVLIMALVWGNIDAGITRLGAHRTAFLLLIGAAWLWIIGRMYAHVSGRVPARWHHWGAAVDTAIITGAVYLTGFRTGETFFLYFWPIATCSIARLPRATVAAGVGGVALYILATWPSRAEGYAVAVTFRALILLTTTALAAYSARVESALVEQVGKLAKEVALAEQRGQLRDEVHDGILGHLGSIGARLDIAGGLIGDQPAEAARLATAQRIPVRQAAAELRALLRALQAPALVGEGFVAAVRRYLAAYTEASLLPATLETEGEERPLSRDLRRAAFRIVQEALCNAEKYAKAQEAKVTVTFSADAFCCTITDDGVGFDRSSLPPPSAAAGPGLFSMKERAASVRGELDIESRPGEGTSIVFTAPVPAVPAAAREP